MKFQDVEKEPYDTAENGLDSIQLRAVDEIAEQIRGNSSGQTGLIIWKTCQHYGIDTLPIARALQKRGVFAKYKQPSPSQPSIIKDTSTGDEYIEVDIEVVATTEKGILADFGADDPVWLPKSQMEDWPNEGEYGTAIVKRWIAKEKGMI